MPALLFYLFALITLGFGLMVVLARNPVTSALSLAMSFVGLAALFISLDAFFIGTIQILVYAGAVMVLFLFIIMLLDIKAESDRKTNIGAIVGAIVLGSVLALQVATVSAAHHTADLTVKDAALNLVAAGDQMAANKETDLPTISKDLKAGILPDTKLMGLALFKQYGFHLQVMGLLLMVGTVGVVVLSKRDKEVAR
ncbi:MAG: NADH-quinone oxidoreductase subunit J [Verrucomicrobia bacterium]|nr:NADH-quinone oxidoreductase subunit J [Verrucomicrobiota bacterium]